MRIRVGTSGYSYREWKPGFYPDGCPARRWLAYYASRLDTVELNGTFYRLPAEKTVVNWKEQVEGDFEFAVKGSRFITHMLKLHDAEQGLERFLTPVMLLGERLGPMLFQLPPRFECNPERLKAFIEMLPQTIEPVFEFRDPSWYCDSIYRILETHNIPMTHAHMGDWLGPRFLTGDVAYVRLHGTSSWFKGKYSPQFLGALASWLEDARVRKAYVFFNNTTGLDAIENALHLNALLKPR